MSQEVLAISSFEVARGDTASIVDQLIDPAGGIVLVQDAPDMPLVTPILSAMHDVASRPHVESVTWDDTAGFICDPGETDPIDPEITHALRTRIEAHDTLVQGVVGELTGRFVASAELGITFVDSLQIERRIGAIQRRPLRQLGTYNQDVHADQSIVTIHSGDSRRGFGIHLPGTSFPRDQRIPEGYALLMAGRHLSHLTRYEVMQGTLDAKANPTIHYSFAPNEGDVRARSVELYRMIPTELEKLPEACRPVYEK